MGIPRTEWKWCGGAGHFICSHDCEFRLNTAVGRYRISTVGDMRHGRGGEMQTIGAGDSAFFETLIFLCTDEVDVCGVCLKIKDWCEIDGRRCATWEEANTQHVEFCEKYAAVPASEHEEAR